MDVANSRPWRASSGCCRIPFAMAQGLAPLPCAGSCPTHPGRYRCAGLQLWPSPCARR